MADNELIVTGPTWVAMKEQVGMLVKSGFLPESIKTPEQAVAIALKGREIGMPMMQAFSNIHVIKGKPTLSAEGMNALIRKNCPKAKIEILENDDNRCIIRATRPGEASFTYSYSFDDAKRAGITGNPSWSKYPDAMLFARCISTIARRVFPDCIQGISYTPGELGAEVSEDGEIINVFSESIDRKTEDRDAGTSDNLAPINEPKPESKTKSPFNPLVTDHVNALKRLLTAKGITNPTDIEIIIKSMEGKSITDLDSVIKELGG